MNLQVCSNQPQKGALVVVWLVGSQENRDTGNILREDLSKGLGLPEEIYLK